MTEYVGAALAVSLAQRVILAAFPIASAVLCKIVWDLALDLRECFRQDAEVLCRLWYVLYCQDIRWLPLPSHDDSVGDRIYLQGTSFTECQTRWMASAAKEVRNIRFVCRQQRELWYIRLSVAFLNAANCPGCHQQRNRRGNGKR